MSLFSYRPDVVALMRKLPILPGYRPLVPLHLKRNSVLVPYITKEVIIPISNIYATNYYSKQNAVENIRLHVFVVPLEYIYLSGINCCQGINNGNH